MSQHLWHHRVRSKSVTGIGSLNDRTKTKFRPTFECLEDRTAPAVFNPLAATADGAAGSLRADIIAANANADTSNTFNLQAGNYNLTNSAGELGLTAPGKTYIFAGHGAGVTFITQTVADRLFLIDGGGYTISFSGLTLTGGNSAGSGGAVLLENGDPSNHISFTNCVFSNNHSGNLGGAFEGFGPTHAGTVSFTGCTFSNNIAASKGGAIDSPGLNLVISACTFVGNQSHGDGGALSIGNGGTGNTIVNSTFSGNRSTAGSGGAITFTFGGTFNIADCTFAANHAASHGGALNNTSTMTLANTIVAGDTALVGPDIFGPVKANFCLIQNISGWTPVPVSANNITGKDPMLAPLANNGGPTQTMGLLPISAAINAGSNALVPSGVTTDQRGPGFARIVNGVVDIGAFELQSPSDAVRNLITYVKSLTDLNQGQQNALISTLAGVIDALERATTRPRRTSSMPLKTRSMPSSKPAI
jgi:predicted outer membrane repeat protein